MRARQRHRCVQGLPRPQDSVPARQVINQRGTDDQPASGGQSASLRARCGDQEGAPRRVKGARRRRRCITTVRTEASPRGRRSCPSRRPGPGQARHPCADAASHHAAAADRSRGATWPAVPGAHPPSSHPLAPAILWPWPAFLLPAPQLIQACGALVFRSFLPNSWLVWQTCSAYPVLDGRSLCAICSSMSRPPAATSSRVDLPTPSIWPPRARSPATSRDWARVHARTRA